MKTKYTASFSDNTTIVRNSDKIYTHAWMLAVDGVKKFGFSSSKALAKKSAEAEAGMGFKTASFMSSNDKAKLAKLRSAHLAKCLIEFVEVQS